MIAPPDHAAGPETPLGALIWRLPPGSEALSSATVGGGFARPEWMLNLRVGPDYARTDVAEHIATVARSLALTGDGIGFLTAADVGRYGHQEERGVRADATAGVSEPTWAAASDEVGPAPLVGTVTRDAVGAAIDHQREAMG